MSDRAYDKLVLEIEIPGFNADGIQDAADEWSNGDPLTILIDEMMREDVGVVFVTIPGEKCQNHDFDVRAMDGRIVGARIVRDGDQRGTHDDGSAVVPESAPEIAPGGCPGTTQ